MKKILYFILLLVFFICTCKKDNIIINNNTNDTIITGYGDVRFINVDKEEYDFCYLLDTSFYSEILFEHLPNIKTNVVLYWIDLNHNSYFIEGYFIPIKNSTINCYVSWNKYVYYLDSNDFHPIDKYWKYSRLK